MLMTNWNWFKGETMSGGENIQGIQLGYRHKDFDGWLALSLIRFTDNYKQETENWNQLRLFPTVRITSRKVPVVCGDDFL